MRSDDARTMECALVEDEVIRLILRPQLPFYPDQVSLTATKAGVDIELREGRSKITFKITENDLENPAALRSATVVNLVEFTSRGSEPVRDTLIEITRRSL